MKLFNKTLYIFISLIVFQAFLTIVLITNFIRKNNTQEAKVEVENESADVYESLNAWKRSIWENLISLKNDNKLKLIINRENYSDIELINYLKNYFMGSGFDFILVQSNSNSAHSNGELHIKIINRYKVNSSYLFGIRKVRPHPYIMFKIIDKKLLMIGLVRIKSDKGRSRNVLIIENLNNNFCKQLTLNRRSKISFFIGDRFVSGTFNDLSVAKHLRLKNESVSYQELFGIDLKGKEYNIAVQKISKIDTPRGGDAIFLLTLLTTAPYNEKLFLLSRIVLSVSVISAFLTILISFFLSKNITQPIKNLLTAMYRIKDGNYNTKVVKDSKDEVAELFQGFNDMAEHLYQDKVTMEKYIEQITVLKDYNEKILHSIRAGIAIINKDFIFEKANGYFFDYFNLVEDKYIGRSIDDLKLDIMDDEIDTGIKDIIGCRKRFYSKIKRLKDNSVYEIKLYPFYNSEKKSDDISGCVMIADDISRKIELEEKIFQAEKLASISMLSAGVAHEINNPLGSIMTNIQNLIEDEKENEKKLSLKLIEQETRRIARIVQELLDFSSNGYNRDEGCDANEVISEVIKLIKYSLKKDNRITIRSVFDTNLALSIISKDELEQVMINLIKNSIQAIEETGGITVETGMSNGSEMINISVKDNGSGIEAKVINRIFDPFYTTKRNGIGTGLGLSVVYGIIVKYKGSINVKSKINKGTEVTLTLPVLTGEAL